MGLDAIYHHLHSFTDTLVQWGWPFYKSSKQWLLRHAAPPASRVHQPQPWGGRKRLLICGPTRWSTMVLGRIRQGWGGGSWWCLWSPPTANSFGQSPNRLKRYTSYHIMIDKVHGRVGYDEMNQSVQVISTNFSDKLYIYPSNHCKVS